jgi:hypothetical protein
MPDRDNEHHKPLILDRGDDAIIADAIAPQPL